MDKQTCISKVAQNDDDRVLFARLYDRLTGAEQKNIPAVTCFLSPREQVLLQRMLPYMGLTFYGGCEGSERNVCICLPDYLELCDYLEDERPVAALRADFYEKDRLTHRDFLGALMGLGIKRETVGDIYVYEGGCDFFVSSKIVPFVLDNFISAGRTKLSLRQIALEEVRLPQVSVRQISTTVSSLRLDSLIGSGFGMARGKACDLIAAGKVSVNDLPCLKPDKLLAEGDKLSARGYGKVIIGRIGGKTKKDRISVILERYQ